MKRKNACGINYKADGEVFFKNIIYLTLISKKTKKKLNRKKDSV